MTEITEDEKFGRTLPAYADSFEDLVEYHWRYVKGHILRTYTQKRKDVYKELPTLKKIAEAYGITLATRQLLKYFEETPQEAERWLQEGIDIVAHSFSWKSPQQELYGFTAEQVLATAMENAYREDLSEWVDNADSAYVALLIGALCAVDWDWIARGILLTARDVVNHRHLIDSQNMEPR